MLNHIVIMGRLTRDPELRYTQSQTPVTSFTVAVDRDYVNRDSGERATDFVDCVAWRQNGEFVSKYFRKGSMIIVSGRLQSRKYQDRDGNNRTAWEINAENIQFGESRRREEENRGESYSRPNNSGYDNDRGGYNRPSSNAPASSFAEMEDESDGELPF